MKISNRCCIGGEKFKVVWEKVWDSRRLTPVQGRCRSQEGEATSIGGRRGFGRPGKY